MGSSSQSSPKPSEQEKMVDPDALKEPIFTQPFYKDFKSLTLKKSD